MDTERHGRSLLIATPILTPAEIDRSLIDCEEIHERLIYEHGKKNPHGGQADLHGMGLIFSMLKTRKIHLGAINAWLEKKRELDEYVIEALSK